MQPAFARFWEQIADLMASNHGGRPPVEAPKLNSLELVEQARQEWLNMDNYFDCVCEPELVDHAILLKEAAQKKYMYLLKQARTEGIRAYMQPVLSVDEEIMTVAEVIDLDAAPAQNQLMRVANK